MPASDEAFPPAPRYNFTSHWAVDLPSVDLADAYARLGRCESLRSVIGLSPVAQNIDISPVETLEGENGGHVDQLNNMYNLPAAPAEASKAAFRRAKFSFREHMTYAGFINVDVRPHPGLVKPLSPHALHRSTSSVATSSPSPLPWTPPRAPSLSFTSPTASSRASGSENGGPSPAYRTAGGRASRSTSTGRAPSGWPRSSSASAATRISAYPMRGAAMSTEGARPDAAHSGHMLTFGKLFDGDVKAVDAPVS
jgi:hypothetical protein